MQSDMMVDERKSGVDGGKQYPEDFVLDDNDLK